MSYASYTLPGGGTAYADGDYSTASEIFPSPLITYPIEQDQSAYEVRRRYLIRRSSYSPEALNTADATYTTAYLVAETPVGNPGADLLEFERVYATIPQPRDEYEGYVYEYPASTPTVSTLTWESMGVSSYCAVTGQLVFTGLSSATIGDRISYAYSIAYDILTAGSSYNSSYSYTRTGSALMYAASTITVSRIITTGTLANVSLTNLRGAVGNTRGRRSTLIKAVASRIAVDYWLPGVTASITTPADIDLQTAFRVLSSQGEPTTTVGANTNPSATEYQTLVDNGEELVAEDTQLTRYRGNIYERRTRFVVAQ